MSDELLRRIDEIGVEGVVQEIMDTVIRRPEPAPIRRWHDGRIRTWPEGEERPLALHETRRSPWRRILPAKPCPTWECGAPMFRREEFQMERCANGHLWTDEQLFYLDR